MEPTATEFLTHSLTAIVLLWVCSIGPGLFFVRRFRWTPAETLCASIAGSLIFIYIASMAIFVLRLKTWAHVLLSGICLAMCLACRVDFVAMFQNRQVRRLLRALGFIWFWIFCQQLLIRHYSGGSWAGDWLEHYQRSLFFLQHPWAQTKFLGSYFLTARPPLMNLVCAHYLAQAGTDYYVYEIASGFLNVLPVLPCCLLAESAVGHGRGKRAAATAAMVVLLAANPSFVENVTFAWTKSCTAFFILLGTWFYLRGWKKRDGRRVLAAFILLAAAILTHFYALVWAAGLAGHYLFVIWPREKRPIGQLATITAACTLLLLTWFAWAMVAFGPRAPFVANTTVTFGASRTFENNRLLLVENIRSSIIPWFMNRETIYRLHGHGEADRLRTTFFCLYQTNFLFVCGVGGLAVIFFGMAMRTAPWRLCDRSTTYFWVAYLSVATALGMIVVPSPEYWGAAHLSLQPLILLGLAAIAAAFTELPNWFRALAILGWLVDFSLGILLQGVLENRNYSLRRVQGQHPLVIGDPMPGPVAGTNFLFKHQFGLVYLGDIFPFAAHAVEAAMCVILLGMICRSWTKARASALQ